MWTPPPNSPHGTTTVLVRPPRVDCPFRNPPWIIPAAAVPGSAARCSAVDRDTENEANPIPSRSNQRRTDPSTYQQSTGKRLKQAQKYDKLKVFNQKYLFWSWPPTPTECGTVVWNGKKVIDFHEFPRLSDNGCWPGIVFNLTKLE